MQTIVLLARGSCWLVHNLFSLCSLWWFNTDPVGKVTSSQSSDCPIFSWFRDRLHVLRLSKIRYNREIPTGSRKKALSCTNVTIKDNYMRCPSLCDMTCCFWIGTHWVCPRYVPCTIVFGVFCQCSLEYEWALSNNSCATIQAQWVLVRLSYYIC